MLNRKTVIIDGEEYGESAVSRSLTLIDSTPEYNYSELREQNDATFNDYIATLAEQMTARMALQELIRRTETDEITGDRAKVELRNFMESMEQNVQNVTPST